MFKILLKFKQPLAIQKCEVLGRFLISSLILLILLPVAACREEQLDYHKLDLGVFQLITPGDWESFKENGIDSYVGGLTNGQDTLWFDYGWYSQQIGDYPDSNSLYAQATVNGLEAMFQISKNKQAASVAMSIPAVTKKDRFFISGERLFNPEAVIAMLKTITFKVSDTTKNSNLVFTAFDRYGGRSGAYILNNYCTSCHHRLRDAVGPALNQELIVQRSDDWLIQFFTDRKQVAGDSLLLSRKKQFGDQDCILLNELSPSEIQRLIDYIRN